MKRIILVLIILIIGFSNIKSQDCQTPPCYGEACDCTQWSLWASKQINIEVPGWPNCWIFVDVCYRQCIDQPLCVEMYIKDWFIDYLKCGNGCSLFISWLTSGTDFERARKGNRFRVLLIRHISKIWFEEFVSNPEINIPCDGPARYKITYFLTSCGTSCYTQYPIDDPNQPLFVEYKSCSDSYCCKITQILCENNNGSITQTEEVISNSTIDCSYLNFPLGNCKPGQNVYVYPCIDPCEDF